jgi:hypothetical protein
MTSAVRAHINQANAAKSTGPKTPEGKQRASMNAFQHGLTGNRMMLQEHEQEAYARLTDALTAEFNPATETERQLLQKIVDCHMRINRAASLEANILNFGLIENTSDAAHDDATECMAAQTRSWLANENSIEKLGRYEARLSRQLLTYTKELERIQTARRENDVYARFSAHLMQAKTAEPTSLRAQSASFGETERRLQPVKLPQEAAPTGTLSSARTPSSLS